MKTLVTCIFFFSCKVFNKSPQKILFLIYIFFVVCKSFSLGLFKNLSFGRELMYFFDAPYQASDNNSGSIKLILSTNPLNHWTKLTLDMQKTDR